MQTITALEYVELNPEGAQFIISMSNKNYLYLKTSLMLSESTLGFGVMHNGVCTVKMKCAYRNKWGDK